jgi:hypothetical protein
MWGHCACGHDFGPLYRPLTQLEEPQEPPQPEEYLSRGRINRLLWRLYFVAAIILIVTKSFHALSWLTSAAALVLALLFWAPMDFPSRKP